MRCWKNEGMAEDLKMSVKLWMVPWRWSRAEGIQLIVREVAEANARVTSLGGPA